MLSHPIKKRKFSREFGLLCRYRTSRNFVVRLTSLRRHNDIKFENVLRQHHCIVAVFKIKHSKLKGTQEKRIKHEYSVRKENSVPRDHCFASLGKASWCQTVTLGTEFSICTSHSCKILIISHRPAVWDRFCRHWISIGMIRSFRHWYVRKVLSALVKIAGNLVWYARNFISWYFKSLSLSLSLWNFSKWMFIFNFHQIFTCCFLEVYLTDPK